ncbi:MAG: twin-arginine translocation signal domain-containing protein [Gemmataceae bacterium]
MDDLTRRGLLGASAAAGTAALAGADDPPKPPPPQTDRDRVMAAGLTAAEADCWELIAKAAGKFFALPKLHPMDDHEVAHAIHVIQHKLLARPAYRKYLELAKAGAKK